MPPSAQQKRNVATVRRVEERLGRLEAGAQDAAMSEAARVRELRQLRDDIRGVLGMDLLGPVAPAFREQEEEVDRAWRT